MSFIERYLYIVDESRVGKIDLKINTTATKLNLTAKDGDKLEIKLKSDNKLNSTFKDVEA